MDTERISFMKTLFRRRLDPDLRNILSTKKAQQIPVIIQSMEGIDERIKKHIKKHRGVIKEEYPFIKSCSALLSASGIKGLETLSQIFYICPDRPVFAHLNCLRPLMASGALHDHGYRGKNINMALLDTGTYPHPDLVRPKNRILYFKDFVNDREFAYDDNGHGTFVAGIIAGNGTMSKGTYKGMAPDAGLISLKVLNKSGNGWTSAVLSGMQWIYDNGKKYGIKPVCLPFGSLPAYKDPLTKAAQILWDSGFILCASVGNNGPKTSWISSPAANADIIAVGALQTRLRSVVPGEPLACFSSRGYNAEAKPRPDFVAPGTDIISLNSDPCFLPDSSLSYRNIRLDNHYRCGSGTSAACAAIAGLLCLLLEKYGELAPGEMKSLLRHSCKSFTLPKEQQGHGLPDLNRLL